MPQLQVVQENVTPAGAKMERYVRGTGVAIPFITATPSRIVLQDRNDGTDRQWRNEMADVIEKDPNSERVYIQRGVLLNWSTDRGTASSDLDAAIPGLDVDAETGELFSLDTLLEKVKFYRKAGAMASEASTESVGTVFATDETDEDASDLVSDISPTEGEGELSPA